MRLRPLRPVTALMIVWMLLAVGCRPTEQVSHYRVPKTEELLKLNGPDPSEQSAAEQYRMLAAMIPRNEQAWFFRLTGPADSVAGEADKFRALIASVTFAKDDAPPTWKLPDGWRQLPPSGMRYATIEIPAETGTLDLSVTVLPRNDPDIDSYTLSNLNRWRNQLGLTPASLRQLRDGVEHIALEGAEATLFDLVGRKPKDTMPRGPFAGGTMPADPIHQSTKGEARDGQ